MRNNLVPNQSIVIVNGQGDLAMSHKCIGEQFLYIKHTKAGLVYLQHVLDKYFITVPEKNITVV